MWSPWSFVGAPIPTCTWPSMATTCTLHLQGSHTGIINDRKHRFGLHCAFANSLKDSWYGPFEECKKRATVGSAAVRESSELSGMGQSVRSCFSLPLLWADSRVHAISVHRPRRSLIRSHRMFSRVASIQLLPYRCLIEHGTLRKTWHFTNTYQIGV